MVDDRPVNRADQGVDGGAADALADSAAAPAGERFDDSLARRLLRVIFGGFFLVTALVTAVQLAAEYRHAEQRLQRDIEAMQLTFGPGIADAMWRFNDDILHGILSGMSALPTVVGVKVEDAQGNLMAAVGTIQSGAGLRQRITPAGAARPEGDGLLDRMFSRSFTVLHTDDQGARQLIGRWTIYSSSAIVLKQVEYGFLLILVNSVIKTLALWFIFVFVINRTLGKPLKQLSAFVGELNIDNLGDKSFVLKDHGRHELHLLTHKLNLMIQTLRRSVRENETLYHNLEQMNRSLEAQVAERTKELLLLAVTDPLTGLYNRRKLDEAINAECERIQRYGGSLSIILADVDKFKSVNDTFGHQAGDSVLTKLAELLHQGRRQSDTVGRWGGEEFMIVCPNTDLAAASALAEQLRLRIETADFPVVARCSCSFGVAEMEPGEQAHHTTARVDAALYLAKAGGRNRVERAQGLVEKKQRH